MLRTSNRLRKKADFQKIYRRGDYFFSPLLVVRFLPRSDKPARFACVISAKVAKQAVLRNRLKRQLSEIIRLNLKHIKTGADYVIAVKKPLIGQAQPVIEKNLILLFKKAKLWQD